MPHRLALLNPFFQLTKLTNVVDENARATLTESRLRQEFSKGTAGIERLTSIYDAGVKGSVHYSAFDGLDLKDLADNIYGRTICFFGPSAAMPYFSTSSQTMTASPAAGPLT